MEALAELRGVTASVTYGELATLRRRLWADEESAYRWTGQHLLPAGERAEIEARFERRVRKLLTNGGDLARWAERVREDIAPVLPLKTLLSRHPRLEQPVIEPNVAVWRVLARFGHVFEVEQGWAAVPDIATVVQTTRQAVASLARGTERRTPLKALSERGIDLPDEDLVAWLAHCGYRATAEELRRKRPTLHRLDDRISPGRRATREPTATDIAARLLTEAGGPLHLDELLHRMDRRYSRGPFYNRLNADPRFVRVAPSTFALSTWQMEARTTGGGSSVDGAVQLVETAGRPLHLDEIRARLDRPISREGLRNALNATDRLVRVAPSTYGLRRSD